MYVDEYSLPKLIWNSAKAAQIELNFCLTYICGAPPDQCVMLSLLTVSLLSYYCHLKSETPAATHHIVSICPLPLTSHFSLLLWLKKLSLYSAKFPKYLEWARRWHWWWLRRWRWWWEKSPILPALHSCPFLASPHTQHLSGCHSLTLTATCSVCSYVVSCLTVVLTHTQQVFTPPTPYRTPLNLVPYPRPATALQ